MITSGSDGDGTALGFGAVPYRDASQRLPATPRFVYQSRSVLGRERASHPVKARCWNHVKLLAIDGRPCKPRPNPTTDDNAASRSETQHDQKPAPRRCGGPSPLV
jgi:hypothetical protein